MKWAVRGYAGRIFFAVRIREASVVDSEYIHFDARGQESNDRVHVLRNTRSGVKRDCCPHVIEVPFGNVMAAREVARGIGSDRPQSDLTSLL